MYVCMYVWYVSNFFVCIAELALLHNDKSPLENMHCAVLYDMLRQPNLNIFVNLTEQQWRDSRKIIIHCILGTTCIHLYIHTCIYTYIHTYIHSFIHSFFCKIYHKRNGHGTSLRTDQKHPVIYGGKL